MQRIVLDTNVLVSAILSKGIPAQIVEDLILEEKVALCLSEAILREYNEVLSRAKFARIPGFKSKAELLLSIFEKIAVKYEPQQTVKEIEDEPDNRFLELALASKADVLITGNIKDFTMNAFEGTRILTPREFWEGYEIE